MNNVNDTFFEGHYKDVWRTIIPDELTVKETDFMLSWFKLQPGSRVLDLMCGYGRHALALCRKGIEVTAVDNLHDYITEIKEISDQEQLPLRAVQADIVNYKPEGIFDLAICMGNSLNFFDAADTLKILRTTASHLDKTGKLLINTWSLAEIVIKNHTAKGWSYVGDLKSLADSKYLFHPTRIETETTFIAPDGTSETKMAVDYIFSMNEMESMLNYAGFSLVEVFSIPGKKKFALGEPRAYIIAEKN